MTRGLYERGLQALLGASACALLAVEAPRIGFQALASWPTGSMRSDFTNNNGYGAGVFAGWELGPGRVFRLGYDGVWYASSSRAAAGTGIPVASISAVQDGKPRSNSVTAQYLYFPSSDDEGVYFKVGAGASNLMIKGNDDLIFPGSPKPVTITTLKETGVHLACLAGLGYEFGRNWGVLAQYSFITVNNHTLGGVQTGISYRF